MWDVDSGGPKELWEGSLLREITSGFSRMPPSTVPSGPDIGISLHAVEQHYD